MTQKMNGILVILLAFAIAGCGKKNQSGKSSVPGPGVWNNLGSTSVSNPYASTVINENPCMSGLPRSTIQVGLNMQVAVGGTYIGVTSEGDVAIVTSSNGQGVLTAYICGRSSAASGQGQLTGNPVINRSYNCQIDEITSARMILPSAYGPQLVLNFRAIYFGHGSSLCH
jgi:hypothetical protein